MLSKHFIAAVSLVAVLSLSLTDCLKAQTLYGSAGSLQLRENAHNADWAYNWANTPTNRGVAFDVDVANYEYVPMIWRATPSSVGGQINTILNLENNFGVHVDYVLGFNEPELPTQSNMTVEQALEAWKPMSDQFSAAGIKLVSPAVSGAGAIRANNPDRPDGWLTEFMAGVEAANSDSDPDNDLQVDVIAYHYYTVGFNGTVEANRLIDQIDDLYERYGRPIWITEFAGTSFSLDNPVHSTEERNNFNRAFLDALIPQFDARDYVQRVSWWQFGALGRPYSRLSTVSGGFYTPSIIGEAYMRTTLDAGETYDFATRDFRPSYAHYLKGSNLANNGPSLPAALRAVDVMEGSTTMSGTGDFGFEDDTDAFVHVRDGSILRKEGNNTVSMAGLPITNNGSMIIDGGTLLLENGTELTGNGSLVVNSGGTLATSGGSGGNEVSLDLPSIRLNRGIFQVKDGVTEMTEGLNLITTSTIQTDGNLIFSGETSGSGSISSTGDGTLFLTGTGSHFGGAQILAGKLVVANPQTSATGVGVVLVNGSGTLGGFGQIAGTVVADDQGSVAPGVAETPSGVLSIPPFDDGVLVNAIDFDFAGIQDDAPLTQTSALTGGLRLISGLNFGSSVRPRNAANNGNEFNVAGFRTDDNNEAAANNGDYLTFTIAPVEGLAMIIEDVDVEIRRNGTAAPHQYMLTTSIDGFSLASRWGEVETINDLVRHTLNFPNTGSDPVSDEVEIRISGSDADNDFGNTHFHAVSVDASFVSDPNVIAFDPTGILELGGAYAQLGSATMKIDLAGSQPGEYDQLQVAGNASLNGTLDVSTIDGFVPVAGQTFDIITANSVSGTFSNVIVPAGTDLEVVYTGTTVSLQVDPALLGDVNQDGTVDFSDIVPFIALLRSGGYQFEADLDQDSIVNFSDIVPFINLLMNS